MKNVLASCTLLFTLGFTFTFAQSAAAQKEIGVPNVQVELLNADGRAVQTTTTNDQGEWSFACGPGTYTINVPEKSADAARMAINTKGVPGSSKPVKQKTTARTASTSDDASDGSAADLSSTIRLSMSYSKITWSYVTDKSSAKMKDNTIPYVRGGASIPIFSITEKDTKLEGTIKASWDMKENTK